MTTLTTTQKAYDYRQGLYDPRWKKLRDKILHRDRHQCQACGAGEQLQVHHRQYHRERLTGEWKQPWEYEPVLLVTLCEACHREGHKRYSIPIMDI